MKKLYEKYEVLFAVLWIVAYVVGSSVADQVSEGLGLAKSVTLALHLALSAALLGWIKANGLGEKYGFRKPFYPASRFLFYLPLAVVASMGLWNGVGMARGPVVAVLTALSMLCVGFLEEVIFRGLLFRAMAKDNLRSAIAVSSLTFGLGHIVNVVNGSGRSLPRTLVQIAFAVMVGFALVQLFYRGGSIWPCVIFHSLNNALNAFGVEGTLSPAVEIAVNLALTLVLMGGYALYLQKALPAPKDPAA